MNERKRSVVVSVIKDLETGEEEVMVFGPLTTKDDATAKANHLKERVAIVPGCTWKIAAVEMYTTQIPTGPATLEMVHS